MADTPSLLPFDAALSLAAQALLVVSPNSSIDPSSPAFFTDVAQVSSVPLAKLHSSFLCPPGGEGYGPYSRWREMDLTPCFESLMASVPCGLILMFGALSIAYLSKHGEKRIRGGWSAKILHFKLVSLNLLIKALPALLTEVAYG